MRLANRIEHGFDRYVACPQAPAAAFAVVDGEQRVRRPEIVLYDLKVALALAGWTKKAINNRAIAGVS